MAAALVGTFAAKPIAPSEPPSEDPAGPNATIPPSGAVPSEALRATRAQFARVAPSAS